MRPEQLKRLLAQLPERLPLTDALEEGAGTAWYSSQKEHWQGWLAGYSGPGAYGRMNWERDARFIYNHFQCPPGLLWMAEALRLDPALLRAGLDAILNAPRSLASQCAAFRRVVPWEMIDAALQSLERSLDADLKRVPVRTNSHTNARSFWPEE